MEDIQAFIAKEFLEYDVGAGRDTVKRYTALASAESMLNQLVALQAAMEESAFMKTHSFVGCSLFFVKESEGSKAGVFLIDFAKITEVPPNVNVTHNLPWAQGNYEDGLFIGMANMIILWTGIVRDLAGPARAA